jgi:hypothetical protein
MIESGEKLKEADSRGNLLIVVSCKKAKSLAERYVSDCFSQSKYASKSGSTKPLKSSLSRITAFAKNMPLVKQIMKERIQVLP